jgi:hypothetical protein
MKGIKRRTGGGGGTGEGRRRVYEDEEEEDTVKPCTTLLGSERLITSHPLADSLPV